VEIITSTGEQNIIIGEIYRVPGTNEMFFLDEYSKLLKTISKEKKTLIIGTDIRT
jgi:hypothetical protein